MSNGKGNIPEQNDIAKYIDHTLLNPDSREQDIEQICEESKEWSTASVCVPPHYVKYCSQKLKDSSVKVGTVIGFPLGYNKYMVKLHETMYAIEDGAEEIDLVMNIGMFKDEKQEQVLKNIRRLVATSLSKTFKIIIETALLTREEIKDACQLAIDSKANFVKTSTGFASEGATVENVQLMKDTVQDEIKIKAAGGIRTLKQAQDMINAGADRIGTSSTREILGK